MTTRFTLDVDYHPASDFRVVQLTPPGSACSVQIGAGLTDASLADFADPDGNTWVIQEIGYRPPRGANGGQPLD